MVEMKKIHFLLATLEVLYVLNTPRPIENENETVAQTCTR